jgi:hypothetical protein
VAQREREMIAQRTKDALQAAKARGVVLGNPRLADVRGRAVANLKADAERFARNIAPIIREIQLSGVASNRGIARSLNARGVASARGGQLDRGASWLDLTACRLLTSGSGGAMATSLSRGNGDFAQPGSKIRADCLSETIVVSPARPTSGHAGSNERRLRPRRPDLAPKTLADCPSAWRSHFKNSGGSARSFLASSGGERCG